MGSSSIGSSSCGRKLVGVMCVCVRWVGGDSNQVIGFIKKLLDQLCL